MESKIIEKIHNNTRALTLLKNYDRTYSVIEKNGIIYKTETFHSLTEALMHFNNLSEVFDERTN